MPHSSCCGSCPQSTRPHLAGQRRLLLLRLRQCLLLLARPRRRRRLLRLALGQLRLVRLHLGFLVLGTCKELDRRAIMT